MAMIGEKVRREKALDFSGGQNVNPAANDNRPSSSIMGQWQRRFRLFCYRLLLVYQPATGDKLLLPQDVKQVLPNLRYCPFPVER